MGAGHTYFGNVAGVKSRIDHVCLPQSLLTHVLSCGVLYSVGARLQRVFGPGKRDHIPVNVVFRHASAFSGDAVEPVCKWDKSLLVDGVLRGDHRRELVSKIVARCKDSGINKFADDCDLYPPTPAVLWQQMREVVWDSAYSLYRKKPARQQPRPADTQAAIDAHVEACYVVANLPQSAVARSEREHSHQFLAEILHQWRAALKFYNTRSARDKLLKRDAKTCLADRVVEFNYAHRRGDGAQVWRLGRCLSGFKVGPKRRRYDAVSGGHPGAGEWVSFMGRKGEDGGCSGWEVDWDTRQQSELSTQLEPVRTLAEARQLAKSDLQRVCRLLRIHKLRKAVPAWGVPGEVWRQLVSPNEYYVRRRHGLGFDGTLDTSVVGKCLLALFVSIRLYDVAPLQWHLSQTFQIDKHNNKPACEGLRTINTFEPLGKAFIKTLWDRGQRQSDREWASGYIAHKSRVTPIMQRRIIKHRLRQAGESHCDSFYDAANAFPSVARSVCDDVIDNTCRLADRRLLKQRNNEAILLIHASDRKVFIQSGSGSLQGDSHAGAQFLEQYHPAVDTWLTSLAEHEGAEFYVQDPVNQQFVDASVSTYADDVARTSLCQSATELSVKLNTANSLLSAALRPIGIAQNVGKQVHVPCFVRQGADTYTRAVFCEDLLPGNTCRMAKYLGFYTTQLAMILPKYYNESAVPILDGFLWASSGSDKGCFAPHWFLCSRVWFTVHCYLASRLSVSTNRIWHSWTSMSLSVGGNSCMEQRVRRLQQMTASSTRRFPMSKSGVFCNRCQRILSLGYVVLNFGRTSLCTESYTQCCWHAYSVISIGNKHLHWTWRESPLDKQIRGCSSLHRTLTNWLFWILLHTWCRCCVGAYCYCLQSFEKIFYVLMFRSFGRGFWDERSPRRDGWNHPVILLILFYYLMMMLLYLHVTGNARTDPFATNSFRRTDNYDCTWYTPKMVSTVLLGWFKILLPCRMYARGAETVMLRAKAPRNTSKRPLTEDIVWERDRLLIQQSMLQSPWHVRCVGKHAIHWMRCCIMCHSMTAPPHFRHDKHYPLKVTHRNLTTGIAMAAPSWLLGTGGQSGGPPARRQRVDPPPSAITADNQKKLTILLAKTVLKSCADIRELQSAVLTTLLIPKDTSVVAAMTAATQEHNTKASELRKASKLQECEALGEPHIHAWAAMVHELSGSSQLGADEKQKLTAHLLSADSVKMLEPLIMVTKCRKCYDPKRMRLTLCVHNQVEDILEVVVKGLQRHGAQLKRGVAPRSGNEREMQALLDALAESA